MAGLIMERGIRSFVSGPGKNLLRMKGLGTNVAQQAMHKHTDAWKKVHGVTSTYFKLPQPDDRIQLKYIWLDGTGVDFRGKTMTYDHEPQCVEECPEWSFDGSSTYQGEGEDSDRKLIPVKMVKDPIRAGKNKLILCEVIKPDGSPGKTNYRDQCVKTMEKIKEREPWFGLEQEYVFLDMTGWPLKWPVLTGFPGRKGAFFSGVGAGTAVGRDMIEAHYRACLYANLDVCMIKLLRMPAQAEFAIGPCCGHDAADQMMLARYLLQAVAEDYGVVVTFDPKPVPGEWKGSQFHANFSTKGMRKDGGIKMIMECMEKLKNKHKEHMKAYDPHGGKDHARYMVGRSKKQDEFRFAVADRSASVRIPKMVEEAGAGYFEDRRPSANCDPYRVCHMLAQTCFLDGGSSGGSVCKPPAGPSCPPPRAQSSSCGPQKQSQSSGSCSPSHLSKAGPSVPPKPNPKDDPCDPCAKYWKQHR